MPTFAPAYINLADLYRLAARDRRAEEILLQGLSRLPNQPDLRFALGLAYVRLGDLARTLESLELAATAAPGKASYAYVQAAAVERVRGIRAAIKILVEALQRHPKNGQLLAALVA